MQLMVETLIKAAPERVFGVLLDVESWPRRIAQIEQIDVIGGGPVAVGTRFRETRIMHGQRETIEMTIVEIVPPERLVTTAQAHGSEYRMQHVVSGDASRTRLVLTFQARASTLRARLMTPLVYVFHPLLKRQLRRDIEALKESIERDTSAHAEPSTSPHARLP